MGLVFISCFIEIVTGINEDFKPWLKVHLNDIIDGISFEEMTTCERQLGLGLKLQKTLMSSQRQIPDERELTNIVNVIHENLQRFHNKLDLNQIQGMQIF